MVVVAARVSRRRAAPGLTARARRSASAAVLLAGLALAGSGSASAQPDPTFRATCGELRAKLATLDAADGALVTIEVVAPLTRVTSTGAVALMEACSAPDPQVLCVAYTAEGRAVGDVVILSGGLERRGPDRVVLDPCLHVLPDKPE